MNAAITAKTYVSRAGLEALRDAVGSRYALAIDDEATPIRAADRLEAQAIKADEIIEAVIQMAEEHDLLDDDRGLVSALAEAQQRIASLEAALSDALDALLWTGGSGDFAPEGQANEGWNRLAQPALNNGLELIRKSEGE